MLTRGSRRMWTTLPRSFGLAQTLKPPSRHSNQTGLSIVVSSARRVARIATTGASRRSATSSAVRFVRTTRSLRGLVECRPDPVAVRVAAAEPAEQVERDPDPQPDVVEAVDAAREDKDPHERRPGQDQEAEQRNEERVERRVPADLIDEPPDEDRGPRAEREQGGDHAAHASNVPPSIPRADRGAVVCRV